MSYIKDLRQRVEAAEQRFGAIDERNRKYSEWLIDLMSAVEGSHRHKLTEIDQQKTEVARLSRDNDELRAMLHAILLAVEEGNRDRLTETIHELDTKASALVGVAAGGGSLARLTARARVADPARAKVDDPARARMTDPAPVPAIAAPLAVARNPFPIYTPPHPAPSPLKRSLARFLSGHDAAPASRTSGI